MIGELIVIGLVSLVVLALIVALASRRATWMDENA